MNILNKNLEEVFRTYPELEQLKAMALNAEDLEVMAINIENIKSDCSVEIDYTFTPKNFNSLIMINKEDPLTYRYYVNYLKREKPDISHLSSSFSYLPIFKYIYESRNRELNEEIIFKNDLYIGKPHGFYSLAFAFLDYRSAVHSFNSTIHFLNGNGVFNEDQMSFFHNISEEMAGVFINIKYISETMGSALSVAQGEALIKDTQKYVLMSDAELEMGEFYENLLMQKKHNFNITLLIDYNGLSKQNTSIMQIYELKELLKMFNQSAIIFDTRGFREYLEKELK